MSSTQSSSPQGRPPQRPIKKLLIANRGEIASRIQTSARALAPSAPSAPPIATYTLSSPGDDSHTHSTHVLALQSAAEYMSVDALLALVKQHGIDAVHPGYGFLSESAEFARRAWDECGAAVVGPGWDVLARTGDKMAARRLARECGVPVLPAMEDRAAGSVEEVRAFVERDAGGLPVMLKAVDGGGGRGIRIVRSKGDLEGAAKRAIEESPSKKVFVEKAAVDGFRHVEVQILGDGTGGVQHLWERECSIQRRYQKVVEIAPSTITDRAFVARIIDSAVAMAQAINYFSLGTFEFLANPDSKEFYFLEINPRLQVEHTITESIALTDIVAIQLKLQQGLAPLAELLPRSVGRRAENGTYDPRVAPPLLSAQLRLTAENPHASFSLSIGKLSTFHLPSGNGIRVDTALVSGHEAVITPDFDSLIAKIIVTAPSWDEVVQKARVALEDTYVGGVKTNLPILRGIVASEAFAKGECDTEWFEKNMDSLLAAGEKIGKEHVFADEFFTQTGGVGGSDAGGGSQGLNSSTVLFRKGDAWSIKLAPITEDGKLKSTLDDAPPHHLKLLKVLRNEFPGTLRADIAYATPDSNEPTQYRLSLNATTASSSAIMAEGKHRRGDPSNKAHVVIPFPGKLVEVLVDEGDVVKSGDVICVVQQMKMELEVRTSRSGRVKWITEAEDGEDVAEGALAAELEDVEDEARAKL